MKRGKDSPCPTSPFWKAHFSPYLTGPCEMSNLKENVPLSFKFYQVGEWFIKCDPRTSSITITWELVTDVNIRLQSRPRGSQHWGRGHVICVPRAPQEILMQVPVWEALKEDIQIEVGEERHSLTASDQDPKGAVWIGSFYSFFPLRATYNNFCVFMPI